MRSGASSLVVALLCVFLMTLVLIVHGSEGSDSVEGPAIRCNKPSNTLTMTCRLSKPGMADSLPWWSLDFGCTTVKVMGRVIDFEYNRSLRSIAVQYEIDGKSYSQTEKVGD